MYLILRGQNEELEWQFCKKGAQGEGSGPSPWAFQSCHNSQGPGRKTRADGSMMSHEIKIKSASMDGPGPASELKP